MRFFTRGLIAKAIIVTFLFASVPACVRGMTMDSYSIGIWRLSMAVVGMTLLMRVRHGVSLAALVAAVRRDWLVLAAVGVCFGAHWLTYFQSIRIAGASTATLALSTGGVQMPLLGWLVGSGRPRAAAMVGVLLAMVGSVLCLPDARHGEHEAELFGFVIGVVSATLYAFVPILHQRHARLDNELRAWAQFAFALPVFLVAAPAAEWALTPKDLWLILYLGLAVGLVGHYWWAQLSAALPLSTTSALGYLQLPMTLAMNVLLIGETMTRPMLIGAGLILAGNILALRSERQLGVAPEPPMD